MSSPVTADAIRGIVGIIPTPSTPDADQWSCENSVDFNETSAMVERIVAGGVSILMTNGSFGEGASLTASEHEAFTACVADTLAGRGLLFAGVTTLNTRDTIARARAVLARGAHGLFLGRPMWMALDAAGILRYYRDISEALPGVPVVIYDNHLAFKGKIPTPVYSELSRIPAVVATKHIGGPGMDEDLAAVEGRIRILPIDAAWPAFARRHPDEALACWTGNAADGVEPLVALDRAVMARDWPEADRIAERMAWAQSAMFPGGKLENFVDYNVPIAYGRLEGSGLVRSGPPRPPYTQAPEGHVEGGRETGRRWAQLRREFAATGLNAEHETA